MVELLNYNEESAGSLKTILASFGVSPQVTLESVKQAILDAASLAQQEVVSIGELDEPPSPEEGVIIGPFVVSNVELWHVLNDKSELDLDELTDLTTETKVAVDDVLKSCSDNVQTAQILACGIEAYLSDQAEKQTVFSNLVKSRVGELSSSTAAVYETITSQVLSAPNPAAALQAAKQLLTCSVVDDGEGFAIQSPLDEYTGVCPSSALIGNVHIDMSSVKSAVTTAVEAANNFLNTTIVPALTSAFNWCKSKVVGALRDISDPLDVSIANADAPSLTFNEGFYHIEIEDGYIGNLTSEELATLKSFVYSNPSSLILMTTGTGEFYFSLEFREDRARGHIWYKPYLLSPSISQSLYVTLGTTGRFSGLGDVMTMAASLMGQDPTLAIDESTSEEMLYRGFTYNVYNTIFALAAADKWNAVSFDNVKQLYEDAFTGNSAAKRSIGALLPSDIQSIPSTITNAHWIDLISEEISVRFDSAPSIFDGQEFIAFLALNALAQSIINPDALTRPMRVGGQLAGRYHLLSDSENVEAAKRVYTGVLVVAAAVTATVIGLKISRKVKANALTAQRDLNLLLNDPNSTAKQLKKAKKRADRLSKLAGVNFLTEVVDKTSADSTSDSTSTLITLIKGTP